MNQDTKQALKAINSKRSRTQPSAIAIGFNGLDVVEMFKEVFHQLDHVQQDDVLKEVGQ